MYYDQNYSSKSNDENNMRNTPLSLVNSYEKMKMENK